VNENGVAFPRDSRWRWSWFPQFLFRRAVKRLRLGLLQPASSSIIATTVARKHVSPLNQSARTE